MTLLYKATIQNKLNGKIADAYIAAHNKPHAKAKVLEHLADNIYLANDNIDIRMQWVIDNYCIDVQPTSGNTVIMIER